MRVLHTDLVASYTPSGGAATRKGKDWRQSKGQRMGGGGERPNWDDDYRGRGPERDDSPMNVSEAEEDTGSPNRGA